MHLRNVEIFCDVVQRRSFSKAAEAHQVSQSSASHAVQSLEERLGTQLIDRSKRPFELTPAGQMYFDGCRDLLESFRRVEDRVRRLEDTVAGRVRVAAIYSIGLLQMDGYAERFRRSYPRVELSLEYLHPDEVYHRVLNDEADLGLVSFPLAGGEISSIEWQRQSMVLVVAPRHRFHSRSRISVSDLSGEDFVGFTSELTIRRKIDRWLKEAKVSVNLVHVFDNIENIKRAVEIGSGVAILPLPTVRRECEIGTLKAIEFKETGWHRPLGIIHRRHKALTSAAEKLVELLTQHTENNAGNSSNNSKRNNGR